MKKLLFALFYILFLLSCNSDSDLKKPFLNLGFEYVVPSNDIPLRWTMWSSDYEYKLVNRGEGLGKCLKINSKHLYSEEFNFLGTLPIDILLEKEVELRGKIKVHSVNDGFSGLWIRVAKGDSVLFFDNMKDYGLHGTTDWQTVSLKVEIDQQATSIDFGGTLTGSGTAWFDDFEIFIDGVKLIESDPSILEPKEEEISWLRQYIHPLNTFDPTTSTDKDLEALDQMIGGATVIGLGEASHGTSEIFQMKHRIVKYLVEKHGFDIFSIEANMPESYEINDYIQGRGGQSMNPIKNMYYGVWGTQEVLNMVEWMKAYNIPDNKIQFAGFDMQFYDASLKILEDAFVGDKIFRLHIKQLKDKLSQRNDYTKPLSEDELKLNKEEINVKLNLIRDEINQLLINKEKKVYLTQNIRIIEQYLNSSYIKRDEYMAENLLWIKEQNAQSKITVWAHNGHIQKDGYAMGAHLSKALGEEYLSIGFAFYNGGHTAAVDYVLSSQKSQEAYPGTYEYNFNMIDEPIFILDLREAKKNNSLNGSWLFDRMEFRNIGFSKQKCEFFRSNLSDNFDLIIFIKESTPTKLLNYTELTN